MSTRATIKISDNHQGFYIYRGCDGMPENVLPDIQEVLAKIKGRWSEPEPELVVTAFLTLKWDFNKERIPDYMITSNFHGDESYDYYIKWDDIKKDWIFYYH